MKPERIQFAPWFEQWLATVAFIRKAFACDSLEDALHYANHIHRVARTFPSSLVKITLDEDFVVMVKILPVNGDVLTKVQFALGQRIDEALTYLAGAEPEVDFQS